MKRAKPKQKIVTKAFSVRQPWAHLILHGKKDVENRSQRTRYVGTVAMHASSTMNKSLVREKKLVPEDLPTGCVIGVVDIVDCVRNSKSKSAEPGYWHWVLRNPRALKKPRKMKGWLGLFPLKPGIRIG